MWAAAISGSVFHSRTVRSCPPAARVAPSGANATPRTASVGPVSVASWIGLRGSWTSQSQMVLSVLPAARTSRVGLNATEYTSPTGPVRTVTG